MKYYIILDIEDLCSIDLFYINIPEDERQNAQDALNCDIQYNDWAI